MDAETRKARRDPEKEKFWRERICEHSQTGKSVRQYCVEKSLNECRRRRESSLNRRFRRSLLTQSLSFIR